MNNKIKFPFAVRIEDLCEYSVDKLTEAFKRLGAVEVDTPATFVAHFWRFYGVDYAGQTRFWNFLDQFGEDCISYTYDEFMELVQSTGAEEKKDTPKEITAVKTYEVYSNGNLMLSGTKEYLEKFVAAIKEALDE